jgi:hypothetical protein
VDGESGVHANVTIVAIRFTIHHARCGVRDNECARDRRLRRCIFFMIRSPACVAREKSRLTKN